MGDGVDVGGEGLRLSRIDGGGVEDGDGGELVRVVMEDEHCQALPWRLCAPFLGPQTGPSSPPYS